MTLITHALAFLAGGIVARKYPALAERVAARIKSFRK